jgi:hypothetical protein
VLKQQGRVSLDADWNEQIDIIGHERETRTEDIIGHCGAPGEGGGFGVTLFTDDLKDLRISEGRFYAAGQLCEPRLHAKVPVVGFPTADRAQLAAPAADGRLFAEEEWLSVCLGTDEAGTEAKVSHAEVIDGATVLTFDRNVWTTGSPTFGTVQCLLLYRKQVDYPIDDLEAVRPSRAGT